MKIALIGYGRMGRAIERIALERGHEICLIISSSNKTALGLNALKEADVAIEFTQPDAAVHNLLVAINAGVPVVTGTTGWHRHLARVEETCRQKNGALIQATNFSVGVQLFFEVNKQLARLMQNHPQYDVSIEEIHHTGKKDAPSGTGITLAEQILEAISRKKHWVNREARDETELSLVFKREDPAAGTHSVTYSSPVDDIQITHTAHNREGFALGAVLAAEFLKGKQGIFSMKDVLGL